MTRASQCDEAVVAVGLSMTFVSGDGNLTVVFRYLTFTADRGMTAITGPSE